MCHHISELTAPCPECLGDGGFEHVPSGRWSTCTFCDGTGEVDTIDADGLDDLDERCGDYLPEPLDPMRGVEFPFAENH